MTDTDRIHSLAAISALRTSLTAAGRKRDLVTAEMRQLRHALELAQADAEAASTQLQTAVARAMTAETNLYYVRNSTLWRVMEPVRTVSRAARRILGYRDNLAHEHLSPQTVSESSSSQESVPVAVIEITPRAAQTMPANDGNLESAKLTFPQNEERLVSTADGLPQVTALIIVSGAPLLTLQCFRALMRQSPIDLEVVLICIMSPDEERVTFDQMDGAHVIDAHGKEGFAQTVNKAAGAARGRFLLLLSSSTVLREGALAAALHALNRNSAIGAVGARLIQPSGLVREAGGSIWRDGMALRFGPGLKHDSGEIMFRREVDFCSSEFLLTRKATFECVGGFDDGYDTALMRDADYCLRLWRAGSRVLYEPRAVAHCNDAMQVPVDERLASADLRRFRERHVAALNAMHLPALEGSVLPAHLRLPSRPALLVIDNFVPRDVLGAGYPRARAILNNAIAAGWSVTLLPLHDTEISWDDAYAGLAPELEIQSKPGLAGLAEFLADRQGCYDAILVSRPDVMREVRSALTDRPELLSGSRLVYDAEALFSSREITHAAAQGRPMLAGEAEALVAREIALTENADLVLTVSESEAHVFRSHQPAAVRVVAHPVWPRRDAPGFAARSGFLFVGRLLEKEAPNYDGLAWFVRVVWPRVRKTLADPDLLVAGAVHESPDELRSPGVHLLGPIADLHPLYDASRVFIAPIQFAAGIPIKILEAAASGLPVLATPLMAKQLGWTIGRELEASDDQDELATAALRLHNDSARWQLVQKAALDRLIAEHDHSLFEATVRSVLEAIAPRAPMPM